MMTNHYPEDSGWKHPDQPKDYANESLLDRQIRESERTARELDRMVDERDRLSAMRPMLYFGMLNSALYIIGVFVLGIVLGSKTAPLIALLMAASIYASVFQQITYPKSTWAMSLVLLPIAFGVCAFVALLFRL